MIEARLASCHCSKCLNGDMSGCPNEDYAHPWVAYSVETGKRIKDGVSNLHWPLKNKELVRDVTDVSFKVDQRKGKGKA